MATVGTLWIREYSAVGWADSVGAGGVSGPDAGLPAPQEPGLNQPRLILADNPAKQSLAFAETTRFVLLSADVAFHYEVGVNPNADVNSLRLPGDTPRFIGVSPGHKLSARGAVATAQTLPDQDVLV